MWSDEVTRHYKTELVLCIKRTHKKQMKKVCQKDFFG